MVMGIIADIRKALGRRRGADPEQRYLEEATSPADLEMRYREIDRGRFRQRRLY
jgi:hypothetical protein